LPGDYNQDGMVRNFPSNHPLAAFSDLNAPKDGNGDGVVNEVDEDLTIAEAAANRELPFRASSGDYYTDDDYVHEETNGPDRTAFDETYGRSVINEADGYLEADGNGSGTVDAADALVPFVFGGNYSAWSSHFGGGGMITEVDFQMYSANEGLDLRQIELLADLNRDWVVDYDDLEILGSNRSLTNPTSADGDLDSDGDIDLDDLDLAFAQLGVAVAVVS
jgi:hypothetical protein